MAKNITLPERVSQDDTVVVYLAIVSMAFSILVMSTMYPVLSGDHHGDASNPGSLASDRCHTDGKMSNATASPYRANA